jgi:hypothetical protein
VQFFREASKKSRRLRFLLSLSKTQIAFQEKRQVHHDFHSGPQGPQNQWANAEALQLGKNV